METQPQPDRLDPPDDKMVATMAPKRPDPPVRTARGGGHCGCYMLGLLIVVAFALYMLFFRGNQ